MIRSFVAAVLAAFLLAGALPGCAVLDAADSVADRVLVDADTPDQRVYRAIAVAQVAMVLADAYLDSPTAAPHVAARLVAVSDLTYDAAVAAHAAAAFGDMDAALADLSDAVVMLAVEVIAATDDRPSVRVTYAYAVQRVLQVVVGRYRASALFAPWRTDVAVMVHEQRGPTEPEWARVMGALTDAHTVLGSRSAAP